MTIGFDTLGIRGCHSVGWFHTHFTMILLFFLLASQIESKWINHDTDVDDWWGNAGQITQPGIDMTGYRTEPTFKPQRLNVKYFVDKESLSPGYIFLATMDSPGKMHEGPQIYDMDGNLIWYGNPFTARRIQDFKVCDYLGKKGTHLCFSERARRHEKIHGQRPNHKVFMDNTYSLTKNFSVLGDGHEFLPVDNGNSFITMNYRRTNYDLRPFKGIEDGRILDPHIIEYSTETGEVMFDWSYMDEGLKLKESNLYFRTRPARPPRHPHKPVSGKSGRGNSKRPWDFAHMNSLDKSEDGNYLASLRHLDAVFNIAGPNSTSGKKPGTILWRLGGKKNQFQTDFNFTKQHHVSFLKVTKHETIISLFNNAWEGYNKPSDSHSSGMIIKINNSTMKASLVQEFTHPLGAISGSRGSVQALDNSNVFIGWGRRPEVSEFSSDGKLLYHSRFALPSGLEFSYRSFKFPWKSAPYYDPKVIAYSHSCIGKQKPFHVYMSWNGATEVKQWRISMAWEKQGPWLPAGTWTKKSFETHAELAKSAPWVTVQALDVNKTVLATVVQKTFVPSLRIKHKCNEFSCPPHFKYKEKDSRADKCERLYIPALTPLLIALALHELIFFWARTFMCWFVDGTGFETADEANNDEPESSAYKKGPVGTAYQAVLDEKV